MGILAAEISGRRWVPGVASFRPHAYRSEDYEGVKDFARGWMRTYLILREKAWRWNADKEIRTILHEISNTRNRAPQPGHYSKQRTGAVLDHAFDRCAIAKKRWPYERLDQLTVDILVGTR